MRLERDVALLRESFASITERELLFTQRFYELLFARHPELQSLFHRRSDRLRARMLREILSAVVDDIEDEATLEALLAPLGARHAEWGVTPEMFEPFVDCLVDTLAAVAAEGWTPAHEVAWRRGLDAVRRAMLARRR